jgi:hypothetical protein
MRDFADQLFGFASRAMALTNARTSEKKEKEIRCYFEYEVSARRLFGLCDQVAGGREWLVVIEGFNRAISHKSPSINEGQSPHVDRFHYSITGYYGQGHYCSTSGSTTFIRAHPVARP